MSKIRKYLIITLSVLCVSLSCAGIGLLQATSSVSADTAVNVQTHGASVRTVSPSGLRFISSVPKSVKDSGTFGTLIIPKQILGSATLNHNQDTAADDVTLNYVEISQTKWATEAIKELPDFDFDENREYFNAVLTEIPAERYDTELVACAYALIDGVYYYSEPITRSIGWVSAAALANGETNDILEEYVDTALANETLAMEENILMTAGTNQTLNLTGNKGYKTIWSTSNEFVATVDSTGKMTAVAEGKAYITARLGTKEVKCEATVSDTAATGIVIADFTADNYLAKVNADLHGGSEGHGILEYSAAYKAYGQDGALKVTSQSFYTDIKFNETAAVFEFAKLRFSIYNNNTAAQGGLFNGASFRLPAKAWTTVTIDVGNAADFSSLTLRLYDGGGYGSIAGNEFYISDIEGVGEKALDKLVDFTETNLPITSGQGTISYASASETGTQNGALKFVASSDSFFADFVFGVGVDLREYSALQFIIYADYNGKEGNGAFNTAQRYMASAGVEGTNVDHNINKGWNIITIPLGAIDLNGKSVRIYPGGYGKFGGEVIYIADVYGIKSETDKILDFTAENYNELTKTQYGNQASTVAASAEFDTTKFSEGAIKYTSIKDFTDHHFLKSTDISEYAFLQFFVYTDIANRTINMNDTMYSLTQGAWTRLKVPVPEGTTDLTALFFRFTQPRGWGNAAGEVWYISDIYGVKNMEETKVNVETNTVLGGNEIVKKVGNVFLNPNEKRNYSAWPNVARLSDGRLMAVWSGNRLAHTDPWGAILASYSSDDGVTWTEPAVIFDSPLDDRDPSIYVEGDTIFIGYATQWDIYRPDNGYHSAADHAQWADYYNSVSAEDVERYGNADEVNGVSYNYIISRDGGNNFEYGGKICAFSPKGIIKLQDGKYFYMTMHKDAGNNNTLAFATSTNLTDWAIAGIIADVSKISGACEPTAVQLASGRIVVHMRSSNGIYQCISDDNGETWSELKLVDISDGVTGQGTPSNLYQHSSGALILTYGHRAAPYGLVARISYDDGETWSDLIRLVYNAETWDHGYSSTIERDDGSLLTIWYSRENVNDANTGIYYAIWELPEKKVNKALATVLSNKKVSVFGTSIECYDGISNNGTDYNTTMANNPVGYGTEGYGDDLDSSYDTWWMQVIQASQMKLNVNNSAGGARCMTDHPSIDSLIAAYKDERCLNLHDNTNPYNSADTAYRVNPDIIFIALGINDFRNGNTAGSFEAIDFDTLITSNGDGYTYATPTTFAEAYAITVHKITVNYADADVFVFNVQATTEAELSDETLAKYNDIIGKIADKYGCTLVDIYGSDMSGAKYANYTFDGLHPVKSGMDKIANVVIDVLEKKYLNR